MLHTTHRVARRDTMPGRGRRGLTGLAWAAAIVSACLVLLLSGALPGAEAGAKLRVVATLSDLADLTQQVGGDRVEVTAICQGYQDPHYLEAKPSYARQVRGADMLVFAGLELEVGWLPPLLDTARNPKLRPGSPGLYEAATALEHVLEVPTTAPDRAQGDIHPFGNPHYLADPRCGVQVARGIAARLAVLDPAGASYYQERCAAYTQRMENRIAEWERKAAPLRGRPVVCYHNQWVYLTDWLGLDLAGYIESRPGIPPSPRHVDDLIETMKQRQVSLTIAATYNDTGATEEVARRAGARAVVLPGGVNGTEGTGTYEQLISQIVDDLVRAGTTAGS